MSRRRRVAHSQRTAASQKPPNNRPNPAKTGSTLSFLKLWRRTPLYRFKQLKANHKKAAFYLVPAPSDF